MFYTVSRITLAAAMLAAGASSALAIEANDFADKLVAASKTVGLAFTYGSAVAEGDTVTLSDFTILSPGEDDETNVPGDLVFEGVLEAEDGGYTAERATVADVEHTNEDDGITFTLSDIAAEGIEIPGTVDDDTLVDTSLNLYDRISAGPLTITHPGGNEVFSIDLMETWIEDAEDGGIRSGYAVSGVRGDLSSMEDAEAQEVIEAFGVEQFSGSLSGVGTWWPDTGRAEIEESSIVIDDLGTLSMTFTGENYTREMYQELVALNIEMAEMAETGEEIDEGQMEAVSQAMMASMADVELVGATLRYEDNSLFMKALEFTAAEQGVDAQTLKSGLQFMVPMAMAEVTNEAFKTMVNNAVNTFINDPQSLEISLAPEDPIAFSELAAMQAEIEADPFVLVDVLGVEVTANQ